MTNVGGWEEKMSESREEGMSHRRAGYQKFCECAITRAYYGEFTGQYNVIL